MIDWDSFKRNLEAYFSSYIAKDSDAAADYIASLYDIAIKGGGDILYKNPNIQGNKDALANLIKSSFNVGKTVKTGTYNSMELIVVGLTSYWAGTQLAPFTPPPGTIGIVSNPSLNPGSVAAVPTFNTTDFNTWIDAFVNMARLHLNTLSGITTSLVQTPTGPVPTPFPWQGYA